MEENADKQGISWDVRNGTELPLSVRHVVQAAGDSVPSLGARGGADSAPREARCRGAGRRSLAQV